MNILLKNWMKAVKNSEHRADRLIPEHGIRAHLRHFCSRDTGTARRCLNQWIHPPRTAGSRSCSPTSPAGAAFPRPHPQAVSPGSCRGKVWGCPCGNLSSTEAFPLLPYFCFLHRKRKKERGVYLTVFSSRTLLTLQELFSQTHSIQNSAVYQAEIGK